MFYVIGKIIIHRKKTPTHFQGFYRTSCLFLNAEKKLQLLPYLYCLLPSAPPTPHNPLLMCSNGAAGKAFMFHFPQYY